MSRRLMGRYIVADDAICHGKPTFIGTRIMVADVLEMVALGGRSAIAGRAKVQKKRLPKRSVW